jgi:hypothetical protein
MMRPLRPIFPAGKLEDMDAVGRLKKKPFRCGCGRMVYAPIGEDSKPRPGVHPDFNGAFAVDEHGEFFCGNDDCDSFRFDIALAAWRRSIIEIMSKPDDSF